MNRGIDGSPAQSRCTVTVMRAAESGFGRGRANESKRMATPMIKRFVFCFAVLSVVLSTATAQSTIFVVRHAEKADATKDPDLSEAGRVRAEALAKALRDANITAIYATEFKRTQQTAAPLAKALGITATTLPAENSAALIAKLRALNGNCLLSVTGIRFPT